MNKLYNLSKYNFKLQFRNIKGIFFVIIFPVLMFLIFSNLLSNTFNAKNNIPIIEYLVPAYIGIIITSTIIVFLGSLFVNHRENKYFIKYKLLGLNFITVLGSLFLAIFIFQVLGIVILILVAKLSKNIIIPFSGMINVILAIGITNIFELSLMCFLVSIIKNSETYQSVSLIVFYFQMFLGGLTFPPEMLGDNIKSLMEIINPIIHGLYVLRGVWADGNSIFFHVKDCIFLLAISFILILVSKKLSIKEFN